MDIAPYSKLVAEKNASNLFLSTSEPAKTNSGLLLHWVNSRFHKGWERNILTVSSVELAAALSHLEARTNPALYDESNVDYHEE